MLQDAEEISLKVDVSVLKEKVNTLTLLCDKMDRVIEKLADNQLDLAGQIYQDMDKRKEDWIEQVLNSVEGRKLIPVTESLKNRLSAIPKEVVFLNSRIQMRSIWLAAASILLLVTMNIATITNVQKIKKQENSLYSDYFSYLNQL